jgi:hypothetical protein
MKTLQYGWKVLSQISHEFTARYSTSKMNYKIVKYMSNKLALLLLFGLWGYWHCGHSWPIVPASGDNEDDCGEADGM